MIHQKKYFAYFYCRYAKGEGRNLHAKGLILKACRVFRAHEMPWELFLWTYGLALLNRFLLHLHGGLHLPTTASCYPVPRHAGHSCFRYLVSGPDNYYFFTIPLCKGGLRRGWVGESAPRKYVVHRGLQYADHIEGQRCHGEQIRAPERVFLPVQSFRPKASLPHSDSDIQALGDVHIYVASPPPHATPPRQHSDHSFLFVTPPIQRHRGKRRKRLM
jgi:hypothetical protein